MRCRVLSAGGLACLWLGIAVVADDGSHPADEGTAAQQRSAQASPSARSPLPTQVWWTDRKGGFVVYASGSHRFIEVDSGKRQIINPSLHFAGIDRARDCTVPAPNGDWSVTIDRRLPVAQFQNRRARPANVPQAVAVDSNPQALAVTSDSKRVLVACDTTGPADRRVAIVDVESGNVTYRPIRGSSNLRGIAV